jgi:hypothetical protein
VDPPVAPRRVLPGQPQHQRAKLRRHTRTATPMRVSPAAPDQVPMPAQQRGGRANTPLQPGRGSSRTSPASTARSAQSSCGRATWRRSTATSWPSTRTSASFAAELLASSPSHRTSWQNRR